MTITFLPLTRPDIDYVVACMAQLYVWGGYDEARQRKGLENLTEAPDHGGTWIIQVDGRNAGYIVLTACYSLEFYGRYGLLDELFVDEQWRGKGVGTKALAFAEEWSRNRGFRALRLEVSHANPGALRLYRRFGFSEPNFDLLTNIL